MRAQSGESKHGYPKQGFLRGITRIHNSAREVKETPLTFQVLAGSSCPGREVSGVIQEELVIKGPKGTA